MTNPRHDHLEGPPMTPTKKEPSLEAETAAVMILSMAAVLAFIAACIAVVAAITEPGMPTIARFAIFAAFGAGSYRSVRWSIRTLKDAA